MTIENLIKKERPEIVFIDDDDDDDEHLLGELGQIQLNFVFAIISSRLSIPSSGSLGLFSKMKRLRPLMS